MIDVMLIVIVLLLCDANWMITTLVFLAYWNFIMTVQISKQQNRLNETAKEIDRLKQFTEKVWGGTGV